MAKFRKKTSATVNAQQFFPDKKPWPKGVKSGGNSPMPGEATGAGFAVSIFTGPEEFYLEINDSHGLVPIEAGDWVITDELGYRCRARNKQFQAAYELAENQSQ